MRRDCPACGGADLSEIYRLDAIPVQSCILLQSEREARDFRRAPLVLAFCDGCGFVFNAAFDLGLVDYASSTEESQHFSGTFNRFADGLVSEIAERMDLDGKDTVEIGCGKGEFLKALAERTGTVGLGIDPGFIPERLKIENGHDIWFRREYFDPDLVEPRPDLVVCRHTLEHIPEVRAFLADIGTLAAGHDTRTFFETPDVRRVLEEGAFWDIYYEHCSYFTLGSHARLFRAAGMDVTDAYLAYDDQYIIQYAEFGEGGGRLSVEDDLDDLRRLARAFPGKVAETRDRWRSFVAERHAAGRRLAVWGGGSKGVSFLTTNGLDAEISHVVDINPFKHGKYLPGTRHRVVAPDLLRADPPDTVIVMNPVYQEEIGAQLAGMGLSPELVSI